MKSRFIKIGLVAAVLAASLCSVVEAAAPSPAMSFSVASGNVVTLTWDCGAGANGATGGGGWSGAQAISGTKAVGAISNTTPFSLTCTYNGKDFADITWTIPTKNTDGSNLTDLAGFTIYSGSNATTLTVEKTLGPAVTSYHSAGNAPGLRCYAIDAFNASGTHSALNPPLPVPAAVCVTMTASQTMTATVTLFVPAAPGNIAVN